MPSEFPDLKALFRSAVSPKPKFLNPKPTRKPLPCNSRHKPSNLNPKPTRNPAP